MINHIPASITEAAVTLLRPYCSELTPAGLVESLKNRSTTTKASPRKPLTRRQAAELLQISIASVNRRMKDGTLRAYKISPRLVRIDPASVEALMETEREITPAEQEA